MDGNKGRQIAFKFKVKQEYEVIIYYEHGLVEDEYEDAAASIEDDAINLAFSDDGLVVCTDEESPNANGYIAFVSTFDPTVEMVYHINQLPKEIEKALKERGLV